MFRAMKFSYVFDFTVPNQMISDKRELHSSGILDLIEATEMIRRRQAI